MLTQRWQPNIIVLTNKGDAALLVRLACYFYTHKDKLWSGKRRNLYGLCDFIFDITNWDSDAGGTKALARYSFSYVKCAKCGFVHATTTGSSQAVISECNRCSNYKPFRPVANPICSHIEGLNDTDCATINQYLCQQYHKQLP